MFAISVSEKSSARGPCGRSYLTRDYNNRIRLLQIITRQEIQVMSFAYESVEIILHAVVLSCLGSKDEHDKIFLQDCEEK